MRLASLVLVVICAPVPAMAQAVCERDAELEAQRSRLVALLLNEVDDHRYDDCGDGSQCHAHILEYAEQIAPLDEQIAARCDSASVWREGVNGLIDPRETVNGTLEQYARDAGRQALYDTLVADRLEDSAPDQETLEVIMTMGAPGSGKSSVLRALDLCQRDVVMVDPDLFKGDLVEYHAARAAHDRLAADRVHRESSMLAKRLRDAAVYSRRDMCIDGVLSKREAALELIERLQAAGYDVTIVAAIVPFDVTWQRVVSRGEETGRFVPYDFVRQAHANIEAHKDDLLRAADRGYAFDTSLPVDEQPRLLAYYEDGVRKDSPP